MKTSICFYGGTAMKTTGMKKTTINLILSIVLALTLPLMIIGKAHAEWLDPSWGQRSTISISNPGGSQLSSFQVHLSLDSTFDFASANVNGSDVRFTSDDGTTLIPFWIESWDAAAKTASIWIKLPTIQPSETTIYLYYGNVAAASASDGEGTFDFFDDFEPGKTIPGYYLLGSEQTVLVRDQSWESSPPHSLSVVQVNDGNYTYWGYYGLAGGCGGVGLAKSNDLVNWAKHPFNPLFLNGRWPSVLKVGNTFYMLYTKDFCATSYIKLAVSNDGINFNDVKTIVPSKSGFRNQNPNLFYNPKDGKYYIYWYYGDDVTFWEIHARSAATPEGLDDPSSENVVLRSTSTLAAPNNFLSSDGTYFLSTESLDSSGQWITEVYSSSSPASGFSLLPGNPILSNGSACNFQYLDGTKLHNYICKWTGSTWTLNHLVADLTAGRLQFQEQIPNPSKWMADSGTWKSVMDMQQDGLEGGVIQCVGDSNTPALISSYQSGDYVLEAYGKQNIGQGWSLGVRATNQYNLYSINLYEDLDPTTNLYAYKWVNGIASVLSAAAVGDIDANTWYKLSIKVHGNMMDVYKGNDLVFQTTSSQYPNGAVALLGEQSSTAEFNNVLVRKYAAVEPLVTLSSSLVATSVTISPSSIIGGATATGTVTLSGPASSKGASVPLASSNPSIVSVPASVTVPGGATSATFTLNSNSVTSVTGVTVYASYGGITKSSVLTVTTGNPVPTTTSISPAAVDAGNQGGTLVVNGTGFVKTSVVRWNGANRTTTFVSPTQLNAAILASDVRTAGTAQVTVFNPAPGGGTSNAQTFTINGTGNPVPTTTNLSPASAAAGGAAFTLTVNGTDLISGSVVRWNGANRTTTFVSSTRLTAAITAADIATAGTAQVTVFNPAPGGGTSNAQTFTITGVTNPVPATTSINPASVPAGNAGGTLTVTGTGFVSGSVVRWNGANRTTTYVSSTQLNAAIPASDVTTAGTAQVTVFNPAPGGGTSNVQTFTITGVTNPVPATTSINPASVSAGNAGGTLTVTGTGFVSGSVVRWNGANRTTTFVSSTQLYAAIPASDVTTAGTAQVTVFNPSPGGGTSNTQTFIIN
jgi:hypothetical protein